MIDNTKTQSIFSPFYRGDLTWLEDWRAFFRCNDIMPDIHQDIPEQFNCLSRIIIFLILVLYLYYGFNRYVWILIVIISLMIILYLSLYKKKSFCAMKETFEPSAAKPIGRTPIYGCQSMNSCFYQDPIILYDSKTQDQPLPISALNNNPSPIDIQQAHTWCMPDLPLGQETASVNQLLAGTKGNPKTNAIPVIPPPIYDAETWSPNDFVVPFRINDQRRQELFQNGYMTWDKVIPQERIDKDLFKTYACSPQDNASARTHYNMPADDQDIIENFPKYGSNEYDLPMDNKTILNATYSNRLPDIMMDTADGYYPENARYNYPVNVPPTSCMKSPQISEYNKNLYSTPLQPNVYTRSQVNQPDASMYNLGISYTQPHLPYDCKMDDRGNMIIDQYDPNQYPSEYLLKGRDQYAKDTIPRNEIYDPRLTGYGTSYRSYTDPMTGQTRFYYDDVDAHTQYNFISRNKIDFTNFAPNSGPYPGLPPDDFRALADNTFHNDIMKQRTELQYRLMAKNSAREWQRRSAPISTNNFSRAGCGMPSVSSYAGPRGG